MFTIQDLSRHSNTRNRYHTPLKTQTIQLLTLNWSKGTKHWHGSTRQPRPYKLLEYAATPNGILDSAAFHALKDSSVSILSVCHALKLRKEASWNIFATIKGNILNLKLIATYIMIKNINMKE